MLIIKSGISVRQMIYGNPMNLIYFIWSLNGGGAEGSIPLVYKSLKKNNINVKVVAFKRGDGRTIDKLNNESIDFTILNDRSGIYGYILGLKNFTKLLASGGIDVVWSSLSYATFIAQIFSLLFKFKLISWQHNAYLNKRHKFLLSIFRKQVNFWVVDSSNTGRYLSKVLKVSETDIEILPLFIIDKKKCSYSKKDDRSVSIGTSGRLHSQKGYDFLLKSAVMLKNIYPLVRFNIAGTGPLYKTLREDILKLNLNDVVKLHGYVDDMERFYNDQDIYFQPSRYEGLCISILEAVSFRLPIIASSVGEIPIYIDNGKNGLLCNVGDVECYIENIQRLIEDRNLRETFKKEALTKVMNLFSQKSFNHSANKIIIRARLL
jgi:glycosyltransferase involved in cell wall biosynthesis